MTALENILFEETLEKDVTHFQTLPIDAHIGAAKRTYLAIRPALTSIGWLIGLIKPKLKKGIDILIVTLDNLFNAL